MNLVPLISLFNSAFAVSIWEDDPPAAKVVVGCCPVDPVAALTGVAWGVGLANTLCCCLPGGVDCNSIQNQGMLATIYELDFFT